MIWISVVSENHRRKILVLLAGMLWLLRAFPASAKIATDFDPNLDFSGFKTFAFIGGVEQLARLQLTRTSSTTRSNKSGPGRALLRGKPDRRRCCYQYQLGRLRPLLRIPLGFHLLLNGNFHDAQGHPRH